MSEHDPQFIPLLQRTLQGEKNIHPQPGEKEKTKRRDSSQTGESVLVLFISAPISSPYLAVATVDECSFRQQISKKGWQVFRKRGNGENLSHPACHINHGLVREAHVQSSVATFQPGTGRIQVLHRQMRWLSLIESTGLAGCSGKPSILL